MTTSDTLDPFCRQCGSSFPPRDGEGTCKEWWTCHAKQVSKRENNALQSQLAERDAALARCIEAMQRVVSDTVLDRQDADYYKRIILVHVEWLREILAALPEQAKRD